MIPLPIYAHAYTLGTTDGSRVHASVYIYSSYSAFILNFTYILDI
jgi:hypothetical protein